MRSLAAKLIIAFLFVGIIGSVSVAFISGWLVQNEFDRFVGDRDLDRITVATALTDYYAMQESWDGVGSIMRDNGVLIFNSPRLVVVDVNGVIVYDLDTSKVGTQHLQNDSDYVRSLTIDGETIGTAFFMLPDKRLHEEGERRSGENIFRRNAWAATIASALIAAVISLGLGIALARSLVRPAKDLTAATQAMAEGEFGQQVQVRSKDEFGELAITFNRMSADLAKAQQTRRQMTADIAHDLRTPLTILRGYTEGLQAGDLKGNSDLYGIMHEEVRHLQHLVEDLRTLSLADTSELALNRRDVDPKALLERTGLAYIRQAQQQGVELRLDAADNLPSICVDTERIVQVLNNLTDNALRHTGQGQIVLGATANDGQVLLTVRDSGEGIAEDEIAHIFNRFYRVDSSRQRAGEGSTGLGLAIAKAIVEAHGGTISVSSVPEQGTTFTIRLPASVAV